MSTTASVVSKFAAILWERGDLVELRAFCGNDRRQDWFLADELIDARPGAVAWIESLTSQTFDVYSGINPRRGRGGKAEDVALARCLWVDFDYKDCGATTIGECLDRIKRAGLPEPTMVVFSGHGVHAYWRLSQAIRELALWTRYQKALIGKLGSDTKIHDAPRIMRMPGTVNFKHEPAVDCLAVGGSGQPVELAAMNVSPADDSMTQMTQIPIATRDRSNLGRDTMRFVAFGEGQGNRDNAMFGAACEYAGNGFSFDEAMADLYAAGKKCSPPLEDWEIEAKVRSAYSRPRSPSRTTLTGPLIAGLPGESSPVVGGSTPSPGSVVATSDNSPSPNLGTGQEKKTALRAVISNVVDSFVVAEDGTRKPITYYKPIAQVGDEIKAVTGGWPKIAGGLLFVARDIKPGQIPTGNAVRTLARAPDLFSYLQESADFRWSEKMCSTPADRSPRSPATKDELLAHLKERPEDRYHGVSALPHHPPMSGVYYLPVTLPAATGEALERLLSELNPDTEDDRKLMLASMLTPGWGGAPGTRPGFSFESPHGRGSGKTSTAQLVADIWGGYIGIGAKEPWEQVLKRLLGDDGLGKRLTLIDNVRGKLGSAELEGVITAKEIDGWRPYHGQYSRPNYLTHLLSANSPQYSHDMAQRLVSIKVGPRRHGSAFVQWSIDFLRDNRAQLVSDLMAILAGPACCSISPSNRDRFQGWQDGVLTRIEGGDELARLIIDRRGGMDADEEDGEEIESAIRKYIRGKGLDPDRDAVRIGRDEMRDLLIAAKVIDADLGKKGVTSWLRDKLGDSGPLARLRDSKGFTGGRDAAGRNARCWLWNESGDPNGEPISTDDDLPPI